MRATQGTTYRTIIAHLQVLTDRLSELDIQAATGKKINKASDDPAAIKPILHSRSEISNAARFTRTMDSGLDRINSMDGHLDQMGNLLIRLKEIAIASINDSLDASNRQVFAEEVSQIGVEMLDASNAQLDGKYLFSGFAINTAAFVENPAYDPVLDPRPVLYQGDNGQFNIEIGPKELVQVNLTGNKLLLGDANFDGAVDSGSIDVFGVIKNVENALRNNDPATVNTLLDDIDQAMEQIRGQRAQMGNVGSRMESSRERMAETEVQMKDILSRYEDADIVQTIALLTQQQTALQAALSVTGKISELSILNYV